MNVAIPLLLLTALTVTGCEPNAAVTVYPLQQVPPETNYGHRRPGPIVREALEVLAAAPEDGSFAAERRGLTSRLPGALRSVP